MFWTRRNCPIEADVLSFKEERRHYSTTTEQLTHIRQFIKFTGVERYEDITEGDIHSYLDSIHSTINQESVRIKIAQSLFLFLRFKRLQIISHSEKRGKGRPENTQRNYALLALRQLNYTYEDIAKRHRLNKRTVYDIIKRLESRQQ